MQDDEVIQEFLIESTENLSRLDQEMVRIEQAPGDQQILASIFRTIHTIKGTCGFLGFANMERIAHHAETILGQIREGQRTLTAEIVSLVLETVDAVKAELKTVEQTGSESGDSYEALCRRLEASANDQEVQGETEPVAPKPVIEEIAEPELPKAEAAARPLAGDSTIRVDVGLLDKLMNLVGELVLSRNQILQFCNHLQDPAFTASSQRLNLITTELQGGVMKTRMQPIGVVWNKLPRVVRDLALHCGKKISLVMEGAGTELDRTIIEAIKDPLTHIVRNSCDHGLETPEVRAAAGKPPTGKLLLRAFHEGGNVTIEIVDDGAGIDLARVRSKAVQQHLIREDQAARLSDREIANLIFTPGFSTAAAVTNISGRGVGMDVVKTNIERIGGSVDVLTTKGQGTTLRIKIPLTLAIIPGMIVGCSGERFVIPQTSLLELIRLEGPAVKSQVEWVAGAPLFRRRGNLLPLAFLDQVLELPSEAGERDVLNIVVLQAEDRHFGLVVDQVMDTQEIVVKPLSKQLKGLNGFAGATIMGDGTVALILDVLGVSQLAGVRSDGNRARIASAQQGQVVNSVEKQAHLLFRAGDFQRLAVPLQLVARLEEFPIESVERAGGSDVVQYRGGLLPLIHLRDTLGASTGRPEGTSLPAIVFAQGSNQIGLTVDEILDIVEDRPTAHQQRSRDGILGSAIIDGRVTDLLDVDHIVQRYSRNWFGSAGSATPSVLVVDESGFGRQLLRSTLELAGYAVDEAAHVDDAVAKCGRSRYDAIIAAVGASASESSEIVTAFKARSSSSLIPVVAVYNQDSSDTYGMTRLEGFAAAHSRFDREGILRSLAQLAAAVGTSSEASLTGAAILHEGVL